MTKLELLKAVDFGQSVAEQELDQLHKYFVRTAQWEELFQGKTDIVYGAKGSGKSALYRLLEDNSDELDDAGILMIFAENPRGATAFADLQTEPPAGELEFVNLWKLYLLTLLGGYFIRAGINSPKSKKVIDALRSSGLLTPEGSLATLFSRARRYISKFFNVESFEPNMKFNEFTGTPEGVGLKISFRDPGSDEAKKGAVSISELLQYADTAIGESEYKIWFLFDRLDVAFAESADLEANALRALFKVYLDFASYRNIKLKLFLRSDIWNRITLGGFREATHITRTTSITWEPPAILNLIVRRFLNNAAILEYFSISAESVKSLEQQESLFYRIFPRKIDSGKNPETLEWLISRTADADGVAAPRDIINLINAAIARQIKHLELGGRLTTDENLFQRSIMKDALSDSSKEKVEKHLFAEYPKYRPWLEALRGGKSQYNIKALAAVWGIGKEETLSRAQSLEEIGFWSKENNGLEPEFWIPLIYREGLEIKQGKAT
jgi:hypothetical protein